MADKGPTEDDVGALLRVYLVLARGDAAPVTVVTAADPEGAMRAFAKSRAAQSALWPVAGVMRGRAANLLAEIDEAQMPGTSDKPGAWLAALAHSGGVIALFEEDAP